MAARGIPNTIDEASSWASVRAPAAFIAPRPSAPSSPIPVMSTPIARDPNSAAAEWKRTSAEGRWPLTRSIVGEHDDISQRHPAHLDVAIARTDQHASGSQQVARLRLLDLKGAGFIQPARERIGKSGRHVLDHHDRRRKFRGHLAEHVLHRIRPAGGDANATTFFGDERAAGALSFGRSGSRRGRRHRPAAKRTPGRGLDLLDQVGGDPCMPSASTSRGLAMKSKAPMCSALKVVAAP